MNDKYGNCNKCDTALVPVYFIENEYDTANYTTVRKRQAVSHLECPRCGLRFVVDDSFDGNWY